MMDDIFFQKNILFNNAVLNADMVDSEICNKKKSIYEVLRLMDGKPLFVEDHFHRFLHSAALQGASINITLNQVKQNIATLATRNNIIEGNVKIVGFLSGNTLEDVLYYFIRHAYPTAEDYRMGVDVVSIEAVRNTPNIKQTNNDLRILANNVILNKNIYEVLLIDHNGNATEGSRSNIFTIKNGQVFTPPSGIVLQGITRKYIIEACLTNNIDIIECNISKEGLVMMDSVFLTGTSPKVLPVRSIDGFVMDVNNQLMKRLMSLYGEKINNYIDLYR